MARSLNTQILVVGRQFPILPFERALAAAGIPDYLCVDTLAAAEMLSADGFKADIVIADAELLDERTPTAWRTAARTAWIAIENDIDDFEEVLREKLEQAVRRGGNAISVAYPPATVCAPKPRSVNLSPTSALYFG